MNKNIELLELMDTLEIYGGSGPSMPENNANCTFKNNCDCSQFICF